MKFIFTILVFISLTGCASIINGSNDKLTVNSLEEGTVLYIDGVKRGRDDALAQVERGETHTIKATKDGCEDVIIETSDSFDKISLLGILLDFGIISIPVDLISGSAWKLEPSIYTVSPICPRNS